MARTLAILALSALAAALAEHTGVCPASKQCDASAGSEKGLPCCQVGADSYECCFSSEACIPKVGCRCKETGQRLPRPLDYAGYTFEAYLSAFGKSHGQKEQAQRRAAFETNLEKVQAHNEEFRAGKQSWFMAMNRFADWTQDEFEKLLATKYSPSSSPPTQLAAQENPESKDWREEGAVTPVKDQGGCGSCWAFSATESVESHYKIAGGKLLVLAPQTYVNCVKNPKDCGGTGGCEGATMELAFNLTVSSGIALEQDMPYQGADAKCTAYKAAVKATGYTKLPVNDAAAVETALATKGPLSVTVAANSWMLYGGGVFAGCSRPTGSNTLDHGVQAVGYSKDYWIVRNSWGASWGEHGYIRLSRSSDAKNFTDKSPADGISCKPYPSSLQVGGECGVLFDTSFPTGVEAAGDRAAADATLVV